MFSKHNLVQFDFPNIFISSEHKSHWGPQFFQNLPYYRYILHDSNIWYYMIITKDHVICTRNLRNFEHLRVSLRFMFRRNQFIRKINWFNYIWFPKKVISSGNESHWHPLISEIYNITGACTCNIVNFESLGVSMRFIFPGNTFIRNMIWFSSMCFLKNLISSETKSH